MVSYRYLHNQTYIGLNTDNFSILICRFLECNLSKVFFKKQNLVNAH